MIIPADRVILVALTRVLRCPTRADAGMLASGSSQVAELERFMTGQRRAHVSRNPAARLQGRLEHDCIGNTFLTIGLKIPGIARNSYSATARFPWPSSRVHPPARRSGR